MKLENRFLLVLLACYAAASVITIVVVMLNQYTAQQIPPTPTTAETITLSCTRINETTTICKQPSQTLTLKQLSN